MPASSEKPLSKSSYKPIVPAVEQACEILRCLGKNPRFKMGVTEIARSVGIAKSKGHSILNTLGQFGFVEKDPQTKTYSLGVGLLPLARQVLDNLKYPEIVSPFLNKLADETHSTALFALIQGDHVVVLDKYERNQNIGFTVRLGHKFHLTLGAHGKAIVAFLPEEERERILSQKKLYFSMDPNRFNPRRLREELARCRKLGYAQDIGGITPGVNVVSSPLFGNRDRLIGCIILMGTFSKEKVRDFGKKVAILGYQISQKLGADVEAIYPKPF
ncbi:MAG: IclR family transcriptional regulator [Desulfobacterota bacterium]|nr:IclR family transcriptional regulator [Thermodesulfobacteriota bacterium]